MDGLLSETRRVMVVAVGYGMHRVLLNISICILVMFGYSTNIRAEIYASAEGALRAAGIDMAALNIGQSVHTLPTGFKKQENEIVAAPGIRVPYYVKYYETSDDYLASISAMIFKDSLVIKMIQLAVIDKTTCMNLTVETVEYLTGLGVRNWKKYWRQDYQVAHWKALDGGYRFGVTCRHKDGIWFLEEMRGLASITP